jgi:hypothetical protein
MTDMPLQGEPLVMPDRPFGRIVRSVFGYALLTALMFLTPLFIFLPAALFHCAIRNGRRAAWIALLIGSAIGIGLGSLAAIQPGAAAGNARLDVAFLIATFMSLALPAMLVLPLVERSAPFGTVLTSGVLAGAAGLGITELGTRMLFGFSAYADQFRQFQSASAVLMAQYEAYQIPADALSLMRRMMDIELKCVPAMLLMVVISAFLLSIMMFGRLLAWRDFVHAREASITPGVYLFRNLSLPDWLLFAFVLGGVVPLTTGLLQKVTGNVLAVVIVLYLLQGLAIFRALLAAVGINGLGLLFAFMMLGFLTLTGGIAPILLIIAGLFDPFFHFRKFRRKDDSNEGHTD